ncbi:Hypothetical protein SMAX5B_004375 [Scophthalmus maximus]|uniref:Uncharacterized protein n=1 Tax=Scophthalmus maximus TaxID=52904 RepID=A0A2U9CQQ0_SCOMX|nr:Hypothetical protein SMAX5B_004375 [Scophthalmus maximus]
MEVLQPRTCPSSEVEEDNDEDTLSVMSDAQIQAGSDSVRALYKRMPILERK